MSQPRKPAPYPFGGQSGPSNNRAARRKGLQRQGRPTSEKPTRSRTAPSKDERTHDARPSGKGAPPRKKDDRRGQQRPSDPRPKGNRPPRKADRSVRPAKAHAPKRPCPKAEACGACALIQLPYGRQIERKQRQIQTLFRDLADESTVFSPIASMADPSHYRNKVISPFAPGRIIKQAERAEADAKRRKKNAEPKREILTGMYAPGTHRLVNTDGCLVENAAANRIIATIRQLMPRFRITPYNEDTGAGFLRHAVVRVGHSSHEVLVTLVTNGQKFPGSRNFCRELVKRCPEITTVVQNINTRDTNVILGDEGEVTLYGPGFILDELCGLSFRISSHSFYQVNAVQTEVLYRLAIEMAGFTGEEVALDTYCGTGTIGLVAAKGLPDAPERHAKQVLGVDRVESAIDDARENATHNGIENAAFIAQDATEFMQELAEDGEEVDVVLMDPPRAGSTPAFLEAACAMNPARIVYISCNPQTQARDIAQLRKQGFRIDRIQGVDMFPHTDHIETVCLLTRKAPI